MVQPRALRRQCFGNSPREQVDVVVMFGEELIQDVRWVVVLVPPLPRAVKFARSPSVVFALVCTRTGAACIAHAVRESVDCTRRNICARQSRRHCVRAHRVRGILLSLCIVGSFQHNHHVYFSTLAARKLVEGIGANSMFSIRTHLCWIEFLAGNIFLLTAGI